MTDPLIAESEDEVNPNAVSLRIQTKEVIFTKETPAVN
jgi:hypothetical protein